MNETMRLSHQRNAATSSRQMVAEAGIARQEAASRSDTPIRPWLTGSGQAENPGYEQRQKQWPPYCQSSPFYYKHTQNKNIDR